MVVTRNQSRSLHQDPLSTSLNRKLRTLGSGGGNNVAVENNPKKVSNGDNKDMKTGRNCGSLLRGLSQQDSILVTFLTETSIHGVKYIAQENRHWSERLFWVVAFLLGVSSSAYLIREMWDRHDKTPVIVTFDATEVDTASIPFPAVTICNNNPISKRLVEGLKLTLKERKSSDPQYIEAEEKLGFVRHLCNEHEHPSGKGNRSSGQNGIRVDDLISFIINDTGPCDELIRRCKFHWVLTSCSSIFRPTVTLFGRCCTFNLAPLFKRTNKIGRNGPDLHGNDNDDNDRREELVEEGHYLTKPAREDDRWSKWQPKKQTVPGLAFGLTITVEPRIDDYYCPSLDLEGVLFAYHSPYEMPLAFDITTVVQLGKLMAFEIIPDITKADPDIRNFQQEKRKCYFANEKKLKFFQSYTRQNCLLECKADYMARKCGCARFIIPNLEQEHKGIKICPLSRWANESRCVNNVSKMIYKGELFCPDCDPLCEEVRYSHQMSLGNLMESNETWRGNFLGARNGTPRHNVAQVFVYFGKDKTIPKLRKALYGWTDLIAITGGILGLCLGFSVISGIELLYFFTLRAFWNKKGQGTMVLKPVSTVSYLNRGFGSTLNVANNNIRPDDIPAERDMVKIQWI